MAYCIKEAVVLAEGKYKPCFATIVREAAKPLRGLSSFQTFFHTLTISEYLNDLSPLHKPAKRARLGLAMQNTPYCADI
jgi:hypothetical protein